MDRDKKLKESFKLMKILVMKLKRSCWRRKETTQGTDNLMRTLGVGSQGGTEERYKGDICSEP